jgi:hypothetical protein
VFVTRSQGSKEHAHLGHQVLFLFLQAANITGSVVGGILLNYTQPFIFLLVSLSFAGIGTLMSFFIIPPPKLDLEHPITLRASLTRPFIIGFKKKMLLLVPLSITRVSALCFYVVAVSFLAPSQQVSFEHQNNLRSHNE